MRSISVLEQQLCLPVCIDHGIFNIFASRPLGIQL